MMNTEGMPLLKYAPHPPCGLEHPPAEAVPATTATTKKTRGTRAALLVVCVLAAVVVGVTAWSGSRKTCCYQIGYRCFYLWCWDQSPDIIPAEDPSEAAAVGLLRDDSTRSRASKSAKSHGGGYYDDATTTETGMATVGMETSGSRASKSAKADPGFLYRDRHPKAPGMETSGSRASKSAKADTGSGYSGYYLSKRAKGGRGLGYYGNYSRPRSKSDKKKGSKKDEKKQKKYRKAALRIVETIDPLDPKGSGDITLSLGFNPLTQGLTLVGSNFVTNGAVFKPQDITVVAGELVGTIPFEKQIGDSSSTCTITKGDFDPENGIIFIASATCNYSTCFSSGTVVDPATSIEQCFFGISGGTLNINAAQLIFGEPINGILLGGTFGFEGLSGKFVVNKIVQGEFPPPSPPVIQYNVFQIDFEFTTDDDDDDDDFEFGPYPNPFE